VTLSGGRLILLALVLLSGCTSNAPPPEAVPTTSPSLSVDDLRAARQQLVSYQELPRLAPEAARVEGSDVADLAEDLDVQGQLNADGFQGAVERTFRGQSRSITGAESRVLVFATAAGASSFAAFLAEHPDPFFGDPSVVKPLRSVRTGAVLIEPPICDCPGAHPLYVAIVPDGNVVLWLQVTGPRASPARLLALLPEI
jgi:hypothetical protein